MGGHFFDPRVKRNKTAFHQVSISIFVFFADIDECEVDKGNCQEFCNNTLGSFECYCSAGFSLQADGLTCRGKANNRKKLLVPFHVHFPFISLFSPTMRKKLIFENAFSGLIDYSGTQRRRRPQRGSHSKTQVHIICDIKELFQVIENM